MYRPGPIGKRWNHHYIIHLRCIYCFPIPPFWAGFSGIQNQSKEVLWKRQLLAEAGFSTNNKKCWSDQVQLFNSDSWFLCTIEYRKCSSRFLPINGSQFSVCVSLALFKVIWKTLIKSDNIGVTDLYQVSQYYHLGFERLRKMLFIKLWKHDCWTKIMKFNFRFWVFWFCMIICECWCISLLIIVVLMTEKCTFIRSTLKLNQKKCF